MNMAVALPHPRMRYTASVFLEAARYPELSLAEPQS
jgi:hypothetical protein